MKVSSSRESDPKIEDSELLALILAIPKALVFQVHSECALPPFFPPSLPTYLPLLPPSFSPPPPPSFPPSPQFKSELSQPDSLSDQ